MGERLGLMISGHYPCVRAGKITLALRDRRWQHDAISLKYPAQFGEAYRHVRYDPFMGMRDMARLIEDHPASVLHVHNEPNWPVIVAKEAAKGRPVIMNVHDVTCTRPDHPMDKYEADAFRAADAFVFVTEEQRQFAGRAGLDVENKPYVVLPNYGTSSLFVDEPVFDHVGGVVYEGGIDKRSGGRAWRDLSPVSDALGGRMHIYPAGEIPDYGIVHRSEKDYPVLIQRLARHDWGFVGIPNANSPGYQHAVPNKIFDYFAAGIPILALNVPLVKPICDAGLGIFCFTIKDVAMASRRDPRMQKRAVMSKRRQFTMEAHIDVVHGLYEQLGVA